MDAISYGAVTHLRRIGAMNKIGEKIRKIMDIFGKKEIKNLKKRMIEIEKKGYFGENENNEVFSSN